MDKAKNLHKKVKELRDDLKAHAQEEKDPECATLCETSSEVLGGLEEAFDNFLKKREEK